MVTATGTGQVYTYNGQATFVRSASNPFGDLGMTSYDVQSGSVTWTFTQADGICTTRIAAASP